MTSDRPGISPILLLVLGIGGVSSASLWFRLSDDSAGPVAFRRLALALPILVVWARVQGVAVIPPREARGRMVTAGLFLAGHFYLWMASLEDRYALSVTVSVLLVSLHPVMILTLELLRGRIAARGSVFFGVALAVAGVPLLSMGSGENTGTSLTGMALAIGGAVAMTGYLLAGRSLRQTLPTATTVIGVYATAAVALAVITLLRGESLCPGSRREWLLALAMAFFPTVLGHTPLNGALRRLPATVVSTAFLAEAVGASLLVWLVLAEVPPVATLWGGPIIAAGIFITGRTVTAATPANRRRKPGKI